MCLGGATLRNMSVVISPFLLRFICWGLICAEYSNMSAALRELYGLLSPGDHVDQDWEPGLTLPFGGYQYHLAPVCLYFV